jgi:ABC-type transporter Mla MlaB component
VCWQVSSPQEYEQGRRELVAHTARSGSRLLIVGATAGGAGNAGAVSAPDPSHSVSSGEQPLAVLRALRDEVHAAWRSGQSLRVLARMEYLASPQASLQELVMHEMELGELAARGGTSVVCAYSQLVWDKHVIRDLAAVHSRVMGLRPPTTGFRLARVDADSWSLDGSVGFESLRAFSAALGGALARTPRARLRCAHLDLIDASGLAALVEIVRQTPGGSVLLEQVNETVSAAWRMSGYAALGAAIEVQP